jgi:hypothetical protein
VFNIELTHGVCLYILGLARIIDDQAGCPMFPQRAKRWLTLYREALLELDLQKMPERIVLASRALQKRSRELQGSGGHYGEKLEIEYALRNLHVAERMK